MASRRIRAKRTAARQITKLVPYRRVSTKEQGESEASLNHQTGLIEGWANLNGYELAEWCQDVGSGKSMDRDGLQEALEEVFAGRADGIVAAKLDRLSRSVSDFSNLITKATNEGWNIVVLDIGLDLTTPHGRLVATLIAAVAQWEREMISERTIDGLEAKRAAGVHTGRKPTLDPEVLDVIVRRFNAGWSHEQQAQRLNADGVPTSQGGQQWYRSTIRAVLQRADVGLVAV